jgi:hypothetical protein
MRRAFWVSEHFCSATGERHDDDTDWHPRNDETAPRTERVSADDSYLART